MPQFADLTAQEQSQIQNMMRAMRPMQAEIRALALRCRVVSQSWFAGVSDLIAALDAGAEIPVPDGFGLRGALPLTKENISNNLMAYIVSIAAYDSAAHLTNQLPACGEQRMLENG